MANDKEAALPSPGRPPGEPICTQDRLAVRIDHETASTFHRADLPPRTLDYNASRLHFPRHAPSRRQLPLPLGEGRGERDLASRFPSPFIECSFFPLARDQRSRYAGLRYPIDRRVVRQVNVFSRLVACEPRALSLLRRLLAPLLRLGLPTANMLAIITGTDHPLGEFAPSRNTQIEPALTQRP